MREWCERRCARVDPLAVRALPHVRCTDERASPPAPLHQPWVATPAHGRWDRTEYRTDPVVHGLTGKGVGPTLCPEQPFAPLRRGSFEVIVLGSEPLDGRLP